MAATDARPVPLKNTAFRLYFVIRDNDGDPVASAAALDSEVSIDGGAFTDCTNEATDEGQGVYSLDLTSSEMNGDNIVVLTKTTTTDAKTPITILYPQEADDIKVSVTHWLGTAAATPTVAGVPEVDVTHLVGVAQSATDLKDFADEGYDPATNKVEGVKTADALTANNDKTGYGLSAAAIQAIWDALTSALTTVGSIGKKLADWVLGSDNKVILSNNAHTGAVIPTVTTLTGHTPQTGDNFARLGAPAGASVSADIAAVKAVLPASLNGGRIRSHVEAMDAAVANQIVGGVSGTADSTTTTTVTDTERGEADTDYWKDAIIVFTAGPAAWQPRRISAFNPATDVITVDTPFTTSPGANTYVILKTAMQQAAATQASVDAIQADTNDIQARLPAALVGGRMASNAEVVGDKADYALSTAGNAAVADKLLGRTRAGGSDGGRTVAQCLAFGRNKWAIAAGVLTVYADDDLTPLYTAAVATAAGDPITSVDPV